MKNILLTLIFIVLAGSVTAEEYSYRIRKASDWDTIIYQVDREGGDLFNRDGFNIPLTSGLVASGAGSLLLVGATPQPDLIAVLSSGSMFLHIEDGETASVSWRFRVPENFLTEGNIVLTASASSNVSADVNIGATVFINGVANVLTTQALANGAFADVTIDYTSLTVAAGDDIVLELGRADEVSGTGSLDIANIYFRYNETITIAD